METQRKEIAIPPEEKDPTLEWFEAVRAGSQAESVLKLLQPMIEAETDRVLRMMMNLKPDLGEYAKLVGAMTILKRLKNSLEILKADGEAANEHLKGVT